MKARAAGWALAGAICIALYWPGLWTWFSMDDFAWLGLRLSVFNWQDLVSAIFSPKAQGTIRPLSERIYFLSLEWLFGLESLPFRLIAFGVQLLNLWLVLRLVERITGSLTAGIAAAALWIVNSALALAMSWSSAFNQILWPCFLLAACHARWSWLTTSSRRARIAEWIYFLLGFGALELQVVYPAIAAALTLLYRRDRWPDLPPLFAASAAYAIFNRSIARTEVTPVYTLYWDGGIVSTLGTYLRMVTGLWRPDSTRPAEAWWLVAEWITALAIVAALAWLAARREKFVLFGLAWFFAVLAPVLPLKNHISDYYLTVPVLGFAMAAGLAFARRPLLAALPALLYATGSAYWARQTVDYNCHRAQQAYELFAGVRQAAQLHPGKLILLTAVNSDQFWTGMNDDPFRLLDGLRVHLAPGGDANIEKHPDLGDPARFVLPGPATRAALDAGQAVVYAPAGGKLRNVTAQWQEMAKQRWGIELATAVDLGQPYLAAQLGRGWHSQESGFRWSDGAASLRLGPPRDAREIAIAVARPPEGGRRGPVSLTVLLNGIQAGRWELPKENTSLTAVAPLPPSLDRQNPVTVDLLVAPVLTEEGAGGRQLGLAFGKVEFR